MLREAWEPTVYVCVCMCVCTQACLRVCAHACSRVLPPPGTSKQKAQRVSILRQIFPKNKARIKTMNKWKWLIRKRKPKLRHLSHGLTLIESILMQSELNEYSIIYRLYMCSVVEEGRLCEQLQVWKQQDRVWTTITDTKRHNRGNTGICALVATTWDKVGDWINLDMEQSPFSSTHSLHIHTCLWKVSTFPTVIIYPVRWL